LLVAAACFLVAFSLTLGGVVAARIARADIIKAHEHQEWAEEYTPDIAAWIKNLKQPDNPGMSCCGEADAYWADEIEVRKGADGKPTEVYAIITDTRPDAPLQRRHVPPGTRVFVPPHKLKWDAGNPTGH